MKLHRFLLLAAIAVVAAVPAFANQPGNCAPTGAPLIGPPPPYDYSANGMPNYNGCWGSSNNFNLISYNEDYDSCNFYRRWYQWNSTGTEYLWQTFVVPYGDTVQHFNLSYTLDFIDPYGDSSDMWRTDVYDLTTGAWLGGDYWNGSYAAQSCAVHRVYCSSTSTLQGHTIQIRFTANRTHSDPSLKINVKYISLSWSS